MLQGRKSWLALIFLFFVSADLALAEGQSVAPKLSAVAAAPSKVAAVQGQPPRVVNLMVSQIAATGTTLVNLQSNPKVSDRVWIGMTITSFNRTSINSIVEIGSKLIDNNGVIYPAFTYSAAGGPCIFGCGIAGMVNLNTFKGGTYKVYGYAKSLSGLLTKTAEFSIVIDQSSPAPAISIISPASGATVLGSISVSFSAANNMAVTSVQASLDGSVIFTGKNSPGVFALDTRKLANGSHRIEVSALDTKNQRGSSSVTFTVNNPVKLSGLVLPNPVSGALPLLKLDDLNANDQVFIAQSGGNILVSTDNINWTTYTGPFQSFTFFGNSGSHKVNILSSVAIENTIYCAGGCTISANGSLRNTIVSIDPNIAHKPAVVTGNSKTSAWLQSVDSVSGVAGYRVHRFDTFSTPAEPSDSAMYGAAVDRSAFPLWGPSPSMADVNQGGLGDCYFLAPLAGFAGGKVPNTNVTFGNLNMLRELAVELPNGKVLTQWADKTNPAKLVGIAVSKTLPPSFATTGPRYAWPVKGIWVPIFEKAFALYRSGQNTYGSLNGGYFWEDVRAFGFTDTYDIYQSNINQWLNWQSWNAVPVDTFQSNVNASILNKQVVTLGSLPSAQSPVVGSHAYSFLWVRKQAGQSIYTVRNPWGFDPSGGVGGGVLELTEQQFVKGLIYSDRSLNIPNY